MLSIRPIATAAISDIRRFIRKISDGWSECRTVVVPYESRIVVVPRESSRISVPQESRIVSVPREPRTIKVRC